MLMFYLTAFESDADKQTFEEIYVKYKDAAFRAALKIKNNRAMAEDALHNGFLRLINNWEKFLTVPCDKRQSLIVIIVKNKMIDLIRKDKKLVSLEEFSWLKKAGEDEYQEIGENDLSEIIRKKEESLFLRECVAKLPDIYKTALELKYFHDMGNSEIAGSLGITPHNAAVRISRATALLARIVKEANEE